MECSNKQIEVMNWFTLYKLSKDRLCFGVFTVQVKDLFCPAANRIFF